MTEPSAAGAECLYCYKSSQEVASENMILPVCGDCQRALERERRMRQ